MIENRRDSKHKGKKRKEKIVEEMTGIGMLTI